MSQNSAPLYMDAVIQPNRSLSRRGLWIVLGVFGLFNLVMALFLYLIGAWPIPLFLGLDFAGVFVAFRIYRGFAGQVERVRVDADSITVSHESKRGRMTVWTSPTAFTRVRFEELTRQDRRLTLHLHNRSLAIGMTLGDSERERLKARLDRALHDALAERHA